MNLYVDASRLTSYIPNGVSRYSRNIIISLLQHSPSITIVLFSNRAIKDPYIISLFNSHLLQIPTWPRLFSLLPSSLFTCLVLPFFFLFSASSSQKKVFWGPSIFVPLFGIYSISTIHDYVHKYFSSTQSTLSYPSRIFNYLSIFSCDSLAHASRFSLSLTLLTSGRFRSKSFLLSNSVIPFTIPIDSQVIDLNFLQTTQYILFVGSIEPRKNLSTLLDSLKHVLRDFPQLHLFVAYSNSWKSSSFFSSYKTHPYRSRIRLYKGLTDQELSLLYSHATFTILPSYYEGFGLPIIESLSHGTPILASEYSEAPYIQQHCSTKSIIIFNPYIDDLSEKIIFCLNNFTHSDRISLPPAYLTSYQQIREFITIIENL